MPKPRKSKAQPPAPKKRSAKKPEAKLPEVTVTSTGTTVVATVVTNGSHSLGRPIFMEPTSSHAVLNNMVSRDSLDPQEELEPMSPTVTGLSATVKAMALGQDISPYKDHIQQIAVNQPEKGDVVRAYVNQANHELIADMIEMRHNAVRHIKRASRRNDVSVSESLVIWRMTNEQLPELVDGLNKNDKAVDTVTVVEKIDYHRQQVERSVQQRWEGTTPQGRELIRKKLWEIERQMKAAQGIHPPGIDAAQPPPDESVTETSETEEPAQNPA